MPAGNIGDVDLGLCNVYGGRSSIVTRVTFRVRHRGVTYILPRHHHATTPGSLRSENLRLKQRLRVRKDDGTTTHRQTRVLNTEFTTNESITINQNYFIMEIVIRTQTQSIRSR